MENCPMRERFERMERKADLKTNETETVKGTVRVYQIFLSATLSSLLTLGAVWLVGAKNTVSRDEVSNMIESSIKASSEKIGELKAGQQDIQRDLRDLKITQAKVTEKLGIK
jgi:hypothetical protein